MCFVLDKDKVSSSDRLCGGTVCRAFLITATARLGGLVPENKGAWEAPGEGHGAAGAQAAHAWFSSAEASRGPFFPSTDT